MLNKERAIGLNAQLHQFPFLKRMRQPDGDAVAVALKVVLAVPVLEGETLLLLDPRPQRYVHPAHRSLDAVATDAVKGAPGGSTASASLTSAQVPAATPLPPKAHTHPSLGARHRQQTSYAAGYDAAVWPAPNATTGDIPERTAYSAAAVRHRR